MGSSNSTLETLAARYVDSVKKYNRKYDRSYDIRDAISEDDEHFMRAVESRMSIPENKKNEFRVEMAKYIGALAIDGKKFTADRNLSFKAALEGVLTDLDDHQRLIEQLCRLSPRSRDLILNTVKETTKTVERHVTWSAFLEWSSAKKIISDRIVVTNNEPQSSAQPKSEGVRISFDDSTYVIIQSHYKEHSGGSLLLPPTVTIYEPYQGQPS